jgi:hypothetical protein
MKAKARARMKEKATLDKLVHWISYGGTKAGTSFIVIIYI